MKRSVRRNISQAILITVMAIICILWILPLIYILLTSFRSDDAIKYNGFSLFPDPWTFETYVKVFQNTAGAPVGRWFLNSLIVAVSCSVFSTLVAALAAYGYARLSFKGRDILFAFLMFTMMIPSVVSLIPNYVTISKLGLKNNLLALILPGLGGVGNVFLIRQFMYSIPKELDESAEIDGANRLKAFFYVILPQMVPVLVVVALNSFLGSWNDLLWPLIVETDVEMRTITSGLSTLSSQYDRQYASMMAVTVVSAIPPLLLYIFAQKYLIKGISLTSGMKD